MNNAIKTKTASTWEDIERYLEFSRNLALKDFQSPVFRGQSNSDWALNSTLQRIVGRGTYIKKYYEQILSIKPMIESLSGRAWLAPGEDISELFWESMKTNSTPPMYDYMVYLRHCGYPSPLLDWSISPYVALYFASISEPDSNAALFSLYKSKNDDEIDGDSFEYWTLKLLSAEVSSHDRHFRQMAKYSMSFASRPAIPGERVYVQYEPGYFMLAKSPAAIISIDISKDLKPEILSRLDDYGINAYTLFGGEDNLVKSIADRLYLHKVPSREDNSFEDLMQKLCEKRN